MVGKLNCKDTFVKRSNNFIYLLYAFNNLQLFEFAEAVLKLNLFCCITKSLVPISSLTFILFVAENI